MLDLRQVLVDEGDPEVALSAITPAEILHGVHRAPRGKQRARREAFVERLLESVPVIPFDLVAARIHARVWAELAAKGTAVGERDLLIGATAMAGGHAVATRGERSFSRIPDLSVRRW